ncbi:MAG: VWA domain-containing protein [Polyangiaceae bacterium]|nr:VWA domain-containing protein [Polyangiaceae bacterium]
MNVARQIFVLMVVMLVACGGSSSVAPSPGPVANDTPPWAPPAPLAHSSPAVATAEPAPDDPPLSAAPPAKPRAIRDLPVLTAPGDLPSLLVDEPLADPTAASAHLPLKSTNARIELFGSFARVEVAQRFENPKKEPIEVLYVFPLPENAAVSGLTMKVGERSIEAKIDERSRAQATYRAAKKEGLRAALLEQERANVFVQSVANIEPGAAIEVTTRYVQDLTYDAGVYEVVFPMVVGPRVTTGTSRLTPPYLGKGERSGSDITIEVIADSALAPKGFVGVTHEVTTHESKRGALHVVLTKKDKIKNRDFVLRYEAATDRPRATLETSPGSKGFFTLTVEPPLIDVDTAIGKREVLFVVDVSGSMAGQPLALSKRTLALALSKLRPTDTFDVLTFSNGTGRAFEAPRPANEASISEALAFVDRMQAGGGTFFVDAIGSALSPQTGDSDRHRYVFFVTDGFVSADDLILRETRKLVQAFEKAGRKAKVFTLGVGPAPNRALLSSIAQEGKGAAVYVSTRETPERAVSSFFRYIDHPVLRDVTIDWGTLQATDLLPAELPDLLASRPLVIHGRFLGEPKRGPVVRARSATGPIEIPVTVHSAGPARDVLGPLWARAKIAALDVDLAAGDPNARLGITRLGLEYGLVTRFTSFVAFDRASRVPGGAPQLLWQPADPIEQGLPPKDDGEKKSPAHQPKPEAGGGGRADEQAPTREEMMNDKATAASPPAEPMSDRGCACRTGSDSGGPHGAFWLLSLVIALLGRRAMPTRPFARSPRRTSARRPGVASAPRRHR